MVRGKHVSVASRPSPRAGNLSVTQLVFVAQGVLPRSTPCVCAIRGLRQVRVFPDRATQRHGLACLSATWVGSAGHVVKAKAACLTACAALRALATSSATRASSAVMAPARFRARATWRRCLRVNVSGTEPPGPEASCSSKVTSHQDRGRRKFLKETAHPAWRPRLHASCAPLRWGGRPRQLYSAITSVLSPHQVDRHLLVGLRAKKEPSSRPASRSREVHSQ